MGEKTTPITGGCLCGAVRFRIAAPALRTTHCYCEMCRKSHGALYTSYSAFPRDEFTLEKGEDALQTYHSSPGVRRIFCRHCGCTIFFDYAGGEDIADIPSGILDNGAHPGHPPGSECHIYVASKAPWYEITDRLPQYPEDHDL